MIQRSKLGLKFFPRRFRRHVYLRDQSIEVMCDILQSRYLRSNVAHKQLARTSLSPRFSNQLGLSQTPSWNSGRDAPVSTSCLFSINLFNGLILFQMHFFLKYNKSILCSYSGFLM